VAEVADGPVFEPGSIFAPGEVWHADIPQDIYDIPYEDIESPDLEKPGIYEENEPTEDAEVAVDWGDFFTGTAQGLIDAIIPGSSGTAVNPLAYVGGTGVGAPSPTGKVTVDPKTGKVTPCHRRRRRRLLTNSDFNDLMRIATLPNKQNVAVALAKAVGRS